MSEFVPEVKVDCKTLPKNPCLLRSVASDSVRNKMDTFGFECTSFYLYSEITINKIQSCDMLIGEMTLQFCNS